jgi:hypothetical protein
MTRVSVAVIHPFPWRLKLLADQLSLSALERARMTLQIQLDFIDK